MTVSAPRAWLRLLALPGLFALGACRFERAAAGRPGGTMAAPDTVATAQVLAALRLYYERLNRRDLKVLSRSFWPSATLTSIMPAPPRTETVQTFSIEELAGSRRRVAPECRVSFSNEMLRATVTTYGPLAQAWATYRFRCGLRRDSTATHYGVDAFLLMRYRGEWRISGLALTREVPELPLAHAPGP